MKPARYLSRVFGPDCCALGAGRGSLCRLVVGVPGLGRSVTRQDDFYQPSPATADLGHPCVYIRYPGTVDLMESLEAWEPPGGGGPKFAGFSGVSPSASGLRWPHRILLLAAVAPRPSRSHPSGLTAWLLTRYRDAPCSQEGPASRCGGWGEGGERKRREQCVPSTGSEAPAKRPLAGPPPSSLLGNR